MKVIHYFPAHRCYFDDYSFTKEQVDQGVSVFKFLFKPGMIGEIPEEFVFVTEPGGYVGEVTDTSGMEEADKETTERWKKFTAEFARSAYERHLEELIKFIKAARNVKK